MDQFWKNLFGLNPSEQMGSVEEKLEASSLMIVEENERKRAREDDSSADQRSASSEPTLSSGERQYVREDSPDSLESTRPVKRFRGLTRTISITSVPSDVEEKPVEEKPEPKSLASLPEDVMAHCLSFLGSTKDRFALQCTSKQFNRISNTDEMLIGIEVGGDRNTGMNGIIQEDDTPETATDKLTPFALAGNLEALYM
jgi:hypothetical protein